jgi:hypothetical protein
MFIYDVPKLYFEIEPKNQNNMELKSHLSFYVYWYLLRI